MSGDKFTCRCCGFKSFHEEANGNYAICEVCFWEDDPSQAENPDYEGGANPVSLRQAQKNFREVGASTRDMIGNVRKPNADELRDKDWKFLG
jgi:hypothetical protein